MKYKVYTHNIDKNSIDQFISEEEKEPLCNTYCLNRTSGDNKTRGSPMVKGYIHASNMIYETKIKWDKLNEIINNKQ